MLVLGVLSCILSLVASTAIPAAPPESSPDRFQSLTAGGVPNPFPFSLSVTFDVPGSNVRVTLTSKRGALNIHPERFEYFIQTALDALERSAAESGGLMRPLGAPLIRWELVALLMLVDNLTWQDPNPGSAGGPFLWQELRAVLVGIRVYMKRIEYEECKIAIWRTATGGFPKRLRKVKHLGSGTLYAADGTGDLGLPMGNQTRGQAVEKKA
ncbi:MAG: hypothetical protein Q9178_001683 [Gyalolechia marmorata]